ncbi:MAG: hypothetical protein V4563_17730 [Pseudomonadota bacterium]
MSEIQEANDFVDTLVSKDAQIHMPTRKATETEDREPIIFLRVGGWHLRAVVEDHENAWLIKQVLESMKIMKL